ncbi:hypothetical protein Sjap_021732 [Stephania japonica]|uniref:Amino acid transporter transmembrane domain-containing protein n=1 Tax=Stephania japonica TaxID=461633 RepID=A0AAP0EMJ6_9MAGN
MLPWAIAQLGWIAGPALILCFSFVNLYISVILVDCYRTGDPINGKRNHTYMDAVRSNLGGTKAVASGIVQYVYLYALLVYQTLDASKSMKAIKQSNCFHKTGDEGACHVSSNLYILMFGIIQIICSQLPNFEDIWWLSILATIMSFTYSSIGIGLGIAKVAENRKIQGSLTGISIGEVTRAQKTWTILEALEVIGVSNFYSVILIEIQDTIRSPPSEAKTMKKANLYSVIVLTLLYMLCGCLGYAAFGDESRANLITDLSFHHPFWLLNIANAAIVVETIGTYQVYCQPLFAFIEKRTAKRWPQSKLITKTIKLPNKGSHPYKLNLFRLVERAVVVLLATITAMLALPFYDHAVGFFSALSFCILSVYIPIEMYIAQKRIPRWSTKWICLQTVSLAGLIVSIASAIGSIAYTVIQLKDYKPFSSSND